MARPVYQYQPINENPDVGIGINLPMNKGALSRQVIDGNYTSGSTAGGSVFGQTYTSIDSALANFKNLLGTDRGERFMQPDLGTDIRKYLFEPNVAQLEQMVDDTIRTATEFWLPYITIKQLSVERNEHTIKTRIRFTILGDNNGFVIVVFANENEIIVSEATVDTELRLQQVGTFGTN